MKKETLIPGLALTLALSGCSSGESVSIEEVEQISQDYLDQSECTNNPQIELMSDEERRVALGSADVTAEAFYDNEANSIFVHPDTFKNEEAYVEHIITHETIHSCVPEIIELEKTFSLPNNYELYAAKGFVYIVRSPDMQEGEFSHWGLLEEAAVTIITQDYTETAVSSSPEYNIMADYLRSLMSKSGMSTTELESLYIESNLTGVVARLNEIDESELTAQNFVDITAQFQQIFETAPSS